MEKVLRNIAKINEECCNGCGICIFDCTHGAIRLENGKAKLIGENLCDGQAACLLCCPNAAISIEQREALPFDEYAVRRQRLLDLMGTRTELGKGLDAFSILLPERTTRAFMPDEASPIKVMPDANRNTEALWPIKLAMLTSFPSGADILICADCAPPLMNNFRRDYLEKYHVVMVCPKFEDTGTLAIKAADMYRVSRPSSITTIRMAAPCCHGVGLLVKGALNIAGLKAPLRDVLLDLNGNEIAR